MANIKILKSLLLAGILACTSFINIYAGEYPKTLTAYLGSTPTLDGYISEGEYADAEFVTGVNGWFTDTQVACSDSLDLSVKVWYKHDGTYLYFAFDVTDNLIYGYDTERWLPSNNANANSLIMGEGWPWFGDGLEIMMNPSYTWDETKKSIGDGTIWQTIVSTHKSTAGGLAYGGLIEGVPYTEYAWGNYRNWYANEHMKANVRIKTKEEGSGYVVEWRISPNPCMQIDAKNFVDLSKENKVGINLEFEDLDNPEDGNGTNKNLAEFCHVDYMALVAPYKKSTAKSFATLLMTPNRMNPEIPGDSISENYETSIELPTSHSLFAGPGNSIDVQTSEECSNNKLIINDISATESAQAFISFSDIDQTVYTSFDIIPEQTNSSIEFDLMSDRTSVVKISFENGNIAYYQNGSKTTWQAYTENTKYRVQIIADNQTKKYTLDVNGEKMENLDYQNSSGAAINDLRIFSSAASVGSFKFDNLLIQDEAIEAYGFFSFDDCWEESYDYEEAADVPSSYIISSESPSDVSVNNSTACDNSSLFIVDSSSSASTKVSIPFYAVTDIVQAQFTVDAGQNNSPFHFDLRAGDSTVLKVGLNSDGKIYYNQNSSPVEWKTYVDNAKYSFQIIANNLTQSYDFIVDADTLKNIDFDDASKTTIDNLTIESDIATIGDIRIDNLVISNHVLNDLLLPFDACAEETLVQAAPNTRNNQVGIYPNPSSGMLIIELEAPHPNPITLTDLSGRLVYRANSTLERRLELDLSSLSSGLYLVNFDNEQGRFSKLLQLIK